MASIPETKASNTISYWNQGCGGGGVGYPKGFWVSHWCWQISMCITIWEWHIISLPQNGSIDLLSKGLCFLWWWCCYSVIARVPDFQKLIFKTLHWQNNMKSIHHVSSGCCKDRWKYILYIMICNSTYWNAFPPKKLGIAVIKPIKSHLLSHPHIQSEIQPNATYKVFAIITKLRKTHVSLFPGNRTPSPCQHISLCLYTSHICLSSSWFSVLLWNKLPSSAL